MSTEAAPVQVTPKPGFYRDIPYEEYARWDAINHSVLRHFNRSAAHARHALVNAPDQTEAQALGHAAHVAVLEPERFDMEYLPAPRIDKRSNAGKAEWASFQASNASREIIPQDEYDTCLKLRESVWAHPTARELLKGPGANELSVLWTDEETGLAAKARLDRLTQLASWPTIVDLKTTKNAARRAFEKDLYYFHYHQQGAMYLDGLDAIAQHPRKYMFIAVEKEPPYCVAVYELEDMALDMGRIEYQKHLRMYAECVQTGAWPGYPEGADLVSLPAWAFKGFDDGTT